MMRRVLRLISLMLTLLPAIAGAQSIELEDCRISAGPAYPSLKARCATVARPENPDDPESASIELRVAVVPALNLNPEPSPLVPLAGGPGQGAIQFYSAYSRAFERVRRDHDILLVDQRGTGDSATMDCPVDDELVVGEYSAEQTVQYMQDCLEQLPHDPRFFTTSVAVRDLEAVRAALGYETLDLYGVSYGTRVAQHYARTYPERTRSVILDGVVPPQLPLGPEIATEAQKALDNIFARCAEDAACNERFPALADDFKAVRDRLQQGPVLVDLQDPTTGNMESINFGSAELAGAVRLLAYHPNSIALLPLMIAEAAAGNFIPLAAQFQMIATAMSDTLAMGMHNSVMCSEDLPFIDDASVDRDALAASYMGPVQLDALKAICSVWPRGPIDDGFHEPLDTDIPVLLLSGSADPITPPRYAMMAAVNLGNARLITNADQGHGQAAVGCMPRVIASFVSDLDPVGLDAECLSSSFVMPFFLDYSGPSP
jgi:pimeloyl-ACP methyl ester carboxylesterase